MTMALRGSNGVAFGPDGRLYVAQFVAGQIAAVDLATGDVEVVVAAGGPIEAPDDLVFGADGSMYIADLVPGRVWRRTPAGAFDLLSDQIRNPNGIAVAGDRLFVNEMIPGGRLLELFSDGREPRVLTGGLAMGNAMQTGPDGYLYYPHMITGEVYRISPDGGTPELFAEQVHEPVAVRFDRAGTLFVLSRDAGGTLTRIDDRGRDVHPTGVTGMDNAAFDADNRMFVSSYATGGITEVNPDGHHRLLVRGGPTGPYGLTVDSGGLVHAADHYGVISRNGIALSTFVHGVAADGEDLHVTSQYGRVRTLDGNTGTYRHRADLDQPLGITVDGDGALVIAESGAARVVAVAPDDTVTVLADGLGRPVDVVFGDDGHCYVSDEDRGAVYRLSSSGPAVVVADLDRPQGITVAGDRLFVAEAGAGRVLSVDLTTGALSVVAEVPLDGSVPRTPSVFASGGLPGVPRGFAGLTTAGGELVVTTDGSITRLEIR
ncbi:outer membrane protein assembly factor BamB family protein [Actinoplanes derwentensis]|uniref:Sugar lactone lactonase YvrE n=1 Tax=Actinoplanes derwentensis TaxID=113562 RepID=A0A1H1Y5A1_9ACTN|nr:PQQ-binding-like beta-propeller repeat protein [Actinoplanes derwentensis]GID86720.1 hypothetical protein Ade03nite_56440 [Actinoplanes derwentensis]SDT16562.1 Sugar lactone lactonase YvrE [Actinoplanes derwentensis]